MAKSQTATKPSPTQFLPNSETEATLCDPCQIKERGATTICGWQRKSLAPHLKAHPLPGGKKWTTALYKKKFPGFSIGAPSYSPPPEQVAKFLAAAPYNQDKPVETLEDKAAKVAEADQRVLVRMDELWSMCERDPAARMICMTAARDEIMIAEFYDELDVLRKAKSPEADKLKFINQSLEAASKRYGDSMTSLALTVKQRRASNLLGSDSVSQLICGYANTLRKMSSERQEAFHRREATVMANIVERIRVKLLDQVDISFDRTEQVHDDDDFRAAILRFNPETN